jgi:hypothetical protein
MSQLPSQSRLSYSRDFLLRYQHIYTPDTTIISRLSPYISPPRSKQANKLHSSSSSVGHFKKNPRGDNPETFTSPPQRFQALNPKKKSQYKTPNSNTERTDKIHPQNSSFSSSYKARSTTSAQPLFYQKENLEINPNTNTYKLTPGLSLAPNLKELTPTIPLRTLSISSPAATYSASIISPVSINDNGVVCGIETDILVDEKTNNSSSSILSPTISQVNFNESKFASLFLQTQSDTTHESRQELKVIKDKEVPNPGNLTSFNFIHDHLSDPYCDLTNHPSRSPSNTISTLNSPSQNPSHSFQNSSNISPITGKKIPTKVSPSLDPRRTPKYRNSTTPENSSPVSTPYRSGKSPLGRPISPLDEQRLIQRQKQIDYGYRTAGYLRYRLLVPKEKRKPEHPRTPKKAQGCSKRSWDGQLKKWRRDLHLWDPDNMEAFKALLASDLVETMVNGNPELAEIVRVVRDKLDNPVLNDDDDKELSSSNDGQSHVITSLDSVEPRLERVARTLVF